VAVVSSSGPAFPLNRDNANPPDPNYAVAKAIDGDPATFCCLLDDTLSGDDPKTIPAKAAAPVTGHIVFDLGRVMLVSGAKLTARKDSGGAMNPKNVDFFYFADDAPANHALADDLEHDSAIRPLLSGHSYQQLGSGRCESVAWDGVVARYVGMRVNESYESGGVHHNFQIGEICFYTSPRPADAAPGQRVPPLYVKQKTLVETLLATRRQYTT